jgi:hypothetical protein
VEEAMDLPRKVWETYEKEFGITQLFDWQVECLKMIYENKEGDG